jgi:hypothetical protein
VVWNDLEKDGKTKDILSFQGTDLGIDDVLDDRYT